MNRIVYLALFAASLIAVVDLTRVLV